MEEQNKSVEAEKRRYEERVQQERKLHIMEQKIAWVKYESARER